MTEKKTYDLAALAAVVEEQKAVIVQMAQTMKGYEVKLSEYEKLRSASAAPAGQAQTAETEVSPQDAAYQAVLKDMGLLDTKED